MIALFAVLAVTAGPALMAVPAQHAESPSCVSGPECGPEDDDAAYRVIMIDEAVEMHDMKMDAYRLNPRPCNLIGNLRCPARGRQLFRLGEPVAQTIARTLGLH